MGYWDGLSFVDQITKASLHTEVHTHSLMYCMIKSTIKKNDTLHEIFQKIEQPISCQSM